MKATFLAVGVVPDNGRTKVTLRDVNGGDENNDFRAGSRTGDIELMIYGPQTLFVAGGTILLEASAFVEQTEETAAAASTATATAPMKVVADNEPVTQEFEGKITIVTLGESVMVSVKPFGTEEEAETDTQEGAGAASTEKGAAETSTNSGSEGTAGDGSAVAENGGTANTQASAAASTAEPAKEGANVADNTTKEA